MLGGAGLLGLAVFYMMHRALVDDAYITLVQVRTLAEHGQWGLIPGHQSNTATSPLNVLVLAAVTLVVRDPVVATGVVYVATSVGLAWALTDLGRSTGTGLRLAVVGTPLLLLNPLLASTMGLETNLAVTLVMSLTAAAARGSVRGFGLLGGALLLTRLDLVVVVGVLAVATPAVRRRLGAAAGWATLVCLPWFMFSWVVLGSVVPDTLLIKQDAHWGNLATALFTRYDHPYKLAVVGATTAAAIGLVALAAWPWWRRWREVPASGAVAATGLAGIAYMLTFKVLGVPPFFWYYGVPLACLSVCAATLACALPLRWSTRWARLAGFAVAAAGLSPMLLSWTLDAGHVPLAGALVRGNWALPGQYARIGERLPHLVGNLPVHSPGEIGDLLYHCNCTMVDKFSDRALLAPAIEQRQDSSWLYRLNYLWLDPSTLHRIRTPLRLAWQRGPDRAAPGWDVSGPQRGQGHLALLPSTRLSGLSDPTRTVIVIGSQPARGQPRAAPRHHGK